MVIARLNNYGISRLVIITCRKKKRPLRLRRTAALRATRKSAQAAADDRVQDQVNGAGEDEKDEGGTLRVKDEWGVGNLQASGCQRVWVKRCRLGGRVSTRDE